STVVAGMPSAIASGISSAVAGVLIALLARSIWKEKLTPRMVLGLVFIMVGLTLVGVGYRGEDQPMKNHMLALVQWVDREQAWFYLLGLGLGAVVGLSVPAVAPVAETTIVPLLALLLYATFLGVPFNCFGAAFKDWKFMSSALVLNFLFVPVVVWILSRFVAHDHVVLVGVLCVLLTPCVDYVIVFACLAKGDSRSLLAAAPVLMIVQLILLPVYFWLFLGSGFLASIELGPFVDAFFWIIVVPLVLAALTPMLAQRWQWVRVIETLWSTLMVPLMMATLGVVVAAHI